MSESAFTILYLLINLFATYALSKLFILFFEHTKGRVWILVLSYLAFYIVNSTLFLFLNNAWINAICTIAAYYLLSINYDAPVWKKIFFVPVVYLVFIITEQIVILIFGWFGLDLLTLGESVYTIWALLAINMMIFLTASILLNGRTFEGIGKIPLVKAMPILILSFCILIFAIVLPQLSIGNEFLISLCVVTLIVITIFIYVFIDYIAKVSKEQTRTRIFENQAMQYKRQVDLLLNQYENIRTIRYNIKGQIKVIYGLIDKEEYDEAKSYIGDITKLVYGNEQYLNTGFVELDCLINYKCNYAKSLNIGIEITTKLEEKIKIAHYEYISVVDNLIDNAVEAVSKMESIEERKIKVSLSAFKGLVYIEISNPYVNSISQENGILKSTKADEDNHGYGLQYIKKIVKKHDGKMQITFGDEFVVKVFMYNACKPS